MAESNPMKWSELRAIIAHYVKHGAMHDHMRTLLADIDAAAPAMADQERRAESWNKIADYVAQRSLMLLEQIAKEVEHADPT